MTARRFEDRHILVTGGATGIGAAIVERFVDEGGRVVAAARNARRGEAFVATLASGAVWHTLDARRPLDWARVMDAFAHDPFDVLVNNAGGLTYATRLHELTPEGWADEIATNLTSAFLGMRAVLPSMLDRGAGAIVNVGSISAGRGQDDAAGYQAAKGGLRLLSRNAAVTYASFGVRVNCVDPGAIRTDAVALKPPERLGPFLARTPLGRQGEPVEVAAVVAFLASDEASFVTGAEYSVDGGYLA